MNNGDIDDLFAMLVWGLVVVAAAGSARLAFGDDQQARRQGRSTNAAIVIGLMVAGYLLLLVDNARIHITSAMLMAVAFNLGYWRGAKNSAVSLSDDSHEILARPQ